MTIPDIPGIVEEMASDGIPSGVVGASYGLSGVGTWLPHAPQNCAPSARGEPQTGHNPRWTSGRSFMAHPLRDACAIVRYRPVSSPQWINHQSCNQLRIEIRGLLRHAITRARHIADRRGGCRIE